MYEKLIFDINEYIVWLIREYCGAHMDQFGVFCFFLSQQVGAFCSWSPNSTYLHLDFYLLAPTGALIVTVVYYSI